MTSIDAAPAMPTSPPRHRRTAGLLCVPLWLACVFNAVAATPETDLRKRYQHAAEYLPWRIERHVHGMSVAPNWSADGNHFWFEETTPDGSRHWQVDTQAWRRTALAARPDSNRKAAPAALDPTWVPSPNGRWAVRRDGHQLARIDLASGVETVLTRDGEADYAYGRVPDSDIQSLSKLRAGFPDQPYGLWSPEGDRFLTYRVDERMMYKLPFVVPITGERHQIPWVHYQNTAFKGERRIQQAELMIFDMRDGARVDLQIPKPLVIWEPTPKGGLRWSDDGRTVFAAPTARDNQTLTAYAADTATGRARALLTDTMPSEIASEKRFTYIDNGKEIIVYSMRSDWGHLYLYDGDSGQLKNAITEGAWAVRDIKRIDSRERWIYFTASGREAGRDPYFVHLYRVRFDGSELTLLTPEDAHHDVAFSPDGRHFIDTWSTVSTPPVSALRTADGTRSLELVRADIRGLQALGWRAPERFKVKSADGKTDLYGVLYLPHDLDPGKSYPIIEPEYMGGTFAPTRFLQQGLGAISLAQVGFAVMLFDGRETLYRSRSLREGFDGEVSAGAHFYDDHIAAMRQLAERHPFIDIERTGIYGHSNGGWRAARALLQHPDFFKVGIATAGSHDYATWINTSYGTSETIPSYPNNMEIAERLQGKLLLMHGYIDDDVHPAQTLQLAEALIQSNRDFDMLILPTYEHKMFWQKGYVLRKSWDYFVEHLLGLAPPANVEIPDSDAPPYRRPMHPAP
ncbi:S9 family peptidase [Luteimonas sp. RIT-PG2_3]